jgi:hypothetical protein
MDGTEFAAQKQMAVGNIVSHWIVGPHERASSQWIERAGLWAA